MEHKIRQKKDKEERLFLKEEYKKKMQKEADIIKTVSVSTNSLYYLCNKHNLISLIRLKRVKYPLILIIYNLARKVKITGPTGGHLIVRGHILHEKCKNCRSFRGSLNYKVSR